MKDHDILIPEPCHVPWESMHGDDTRRFCDACTMHVHNLSELSEAEARALLDANYPGHGVCVQYLSTDEGDVLFRDSQHPAWRLSRQVDGLKRLLATALTIPLLAVACDDSAQTTAEPVTVSPIQLDHDARIDPGASIAPTMAPAKTFPPSTRPRALTQDELQQAVAEMRAEQEQKSHDSAHAHADDAEERGCDHSDQEHAAQEALHVKYHTQQSSELLKDVEKLQEARYKRTFKKTTGKPAKYNH